MLTPAAQAKMLLAVFLWFTGLIEIFYVNETLTDVRIGVLVVFMAVTSLTAARLTKAVAALAVVASIGYYLANNNLDPVVDALKFAVVFAIFLPALLLTRETIEASPELSIARNGFLKLNEANRATGLLVGSQLLASVLTLGVLAITAPLVERGSSEVLRRETLLTVLRGIMLGGLWTPFSVAVIWILNTRPNLSLIEILGPGFLLALAGTVLAALLFSGFSGLAQIPSALKVFKPLIPSLATAIFVVLAFAHFLPFSTIETVALVLPLLCLIRLFTIGPRVTAGAVKGLFARIGASGNELLLFGAAVVLGFLLNSSGIAQTLVSILALDTMPIMAAITLLVLLGPLLALTGMHSVLVGTLLAALLTSLDSRIPDIIEGQILLCGWMSAAMISFGSISVGLGTRLFEVSVSRTILSNNILFQILFSALCAGVLVLWFGAVGA